MPDNDRLKRIQDDDEEESRFDSPRPPMGPAQPGVYAGARLRPVNADVGVAREANAPDLERTQPVASAEPNLTPSNTGRLRPLTFHERQALPATSGDVVAGSPEYYRGRLERLEDQKANPWGSAENHPGFGGRLAHVLASVGNVAGDIVAPGTMARIPGTQLNREEQLEGARKELGQAETRESEEQLRGAQERNLESETRQRDEANKEQLVTDAQGNVTGWKSGDGALHSLEEAGTPESIKQIAADTQSKLEKPTFEKMDNGDIVSIRPGKDGKPTSEVIYHGDPKLETEIEHGHIVGGKPHGLLINKKTGETVKDLGEEKEAAGTAPQERAGKIQDAYSKRIDAISTPIEQRMTRMTTVMETLKQANAQSDAVAAPEFLSAVVGGLGSGLRMTEAEINRIVGGRDAWQSLQAAVQKITPGSGQSLTAPQREQMRKLVEALQGHANEATDALNDARTAIYNAKDEGEVRQIYADTRKKLSAIFAGKEAGGEKEAGAGGGGKSLGDAWKEFQEKKKQRAGS